MSILSKLLPIDDSDYSVSDLYFLRLCRLLQPNNLESLRSPLMNVRWYVCLGALINRQPVLGCHSQGIKVAVLRCLEVANDETAGSECFAGPGEST